MADRPALVLVDGSSYLYRAFHALPPLTNSTGEPTGAVLGVLNMLAKLLKEHDPPHIAVVFDAPGRTFRDDLFAEYKAQREPMPDELRAQVEPLIGAVEALGLPLLRVPGVEADDVIGTLARRAAEQGLDVLISTGDKDMAQLVDERVTLVNTMTDSTLDRAGVKAKFDVYPEQIVDYLALVGDSSDNIPGVPKVGPKTAAKWLGQYATLDNLLAHQHEIEGKVGESLRAHTAELALSRRLATIDCGLDLPEPLEALRRRSPDVERLRELYTRLELRSLLRQLPGTAAEAPSPVPAADPGADRGADPGPPATAAAAPADPAGGRVTPRHYDTVLTEAQFEAWLGHLEAAELFAFDTETTSPCRAGSRPSTAGSNCPSSRTTCAAGNPTSGACGSCTRSSSCARCCGSCRAPASRRRRPRSRPPTRGRVRRWIRRASHRRPRLPATRPGARPCRATTRPSSPTSSSRPGSGACAAPSCSPSTPRPPRSTTCRPRSSACRSVSSRATRRTCRFATRIRGPQSSSTTRPGRRRSPGSTCSVLRPRS